MAGTKIPGLPVAFIAVGGVLVYSGIENQPLATLLRGLARGQKPAPGPPETFATPGASTAQASPSSSAVGPAPSGPGEKAWIVAFLLSIGAPPTPANLDSMSSWIAHESSWTSSPPDGALFTHNPLNTTEPGFGAPGAGINSAGVKVYPNAAEGIAATRAAMTNGDYPGILAALRSGRGLCGDPSIGGELLTWSGNGYSSVC